MDTTSFTLLEKLRQPDPGPSWDRFVDLYTPWLFDCARRLDLSDEDAGDLVQDIFMVLVRELPRFSYDPEQSFRGWLWIVTQNQWRAHQRRRRRLPTQPMANGCLDDVSVPDNVKEWWESNYDQHLLQVVKQWLQAEFPPLQWQAFWRHKIDRLGAEEVAEELGMTKGNVYVAAFRVEKRLKQEKESLKELLD